MSSTLIINAIVINEGKQSPCNILIQNNLIRDILPLPCEKLPKAGKVIDAGGKYVLPGVIDDHVHFREPGLTYKGDIYTESKAAIAGGVTSYMDMPNTTPPAITHALLEQKYDLAAQSSLANFSFYIGATHANLPELLRTNPGNVCGIKLFLGSSTGNMLVQDAGILNTLFSQSEMLIAAHCEDESLINKNTEQARAKYGESVPPHLHSIIRNDEVCYRSSQFAVQLAEKYGTRLHILHLSTSRELDLLRSDIPLVKKNITAEVCLHHLLFDHSDYTHFGNLIKVNPSVKSAKDKEDLLYGLLNDKIDIIATDHAPHTLAEKQQPYFMSPSGGPFVQHSLAAMLEFCHRGILTPELVVSKMCHAPAELFRIKKRGYIRKDYYADLVIVDLQSKWTVAEENILSKCKWSALTGTTFSSRITHTFVNGNLVYENGKFDEDHKGMRLEFDR
jgi:dihydroorotase